jgi:hypothetical protein
MNEILAGLLFAGVLSSVSSFSSSLSMQIKFISSRSLRFSDDAFSRSLMLRFRLHSTKYVRKEQVI